MLHMENEVEAQPHLGYNKRCRMYEGETHTGRHTWSIHLKYSQKIPRRFSVTKSNHIPIISLVDVSRPQWPQLIQYEQKPILQIAAIANQAD